VILLAAAQKKIPVTNLASTMVKRTITGNGHAPKAQMQRAIASLCKLAKPPEPPDVADAIAIGWTLAHQLMRGNPK
jgi:crossover junction endodeoxyribonuclease RuvC